jgi:hypothetical protein
VVPLALLPVAAAVTAGGWLTKWEFERIAETGSGGLGLVGGLMLDWANLALVGLVAGVAVLAVVSFLGTRQRRGGALPPRPARPVKRSTRFVLAGLMVVSVVGVVVAVRAAETALVSVMTLALPVSGAEPPARVLSMAEMAMPERLDLIQRSITTATWGGVGLSVLLVALAVATRRAEWGGAGESRSGVLAKVGAMALAAGAVLGIVQLWPMASWLREIVQAS